MTDRERPPDRAEATGLARAASTEPLTMRGLLEAVGGVLGIAESVLPPLLFVVLYQVAAIQAAPKAVPRADLVPIVIAPLAVSAALIVFRLIRRQSLRTAIGGALVVGVSAALTLATGDANTNFVPGLVINAAYGGAFLLSLLVRRPLIGLVVGLLLSDPSWRTERPKRRMATGLSTLWVALFAIRLAVELPLYLAGDQVVALGIARIVLGLPLYAPVLVLTVLGVQALHRRGEPPAA